MKKLFAILILIVTVFVITACGSTQVYHSLTYQESIVIAERQTEVYLFSNLNGDKVVLFDGLNSSYKNLLEKGQRYDVEVSVRDNWSHGDYIHSVSKSK